MPLFINFHTGFFKHADQFPLHSHIWFESSCLPSRDGNESTAQDVGKLRLRQKLAFAIIFYFLCIIDHRATS